VEFHCTQGTSFNTSTSTSVILHPSCMNLLHLTTVSAHTEGEDDNETGQGFYLMTVH
jgi:hypothetical protein